VTTSFEVDLINVETHSSVLLSARQATAQCANVGLGLGRQGSEIAIYAALRHMNRLGQIERAMRDEFLAVNCEEKRKHAALTGALDVLHKLFRRKAGADNNPALLGPLSVS
jgi:hypothetical protein